jgi:hypothetical protein
VEQVGTPLMNQLSATPLQPNHQDTNPTGRMNIIALPKEERTTNKPMDPKLNSILHRYIQQKL